MLNREIFEEIVENGFAHNSLKNKIRQFIAHLIYRIKTWNAELPW